MERIQIKPSRKRASCKVVRFEVLDFQAQRLVDDLRMIQNCQYGASGNRFNAGPISDDVMICVLVNRERREEEAFQELQFDTGNVEGLS